MKPFNLEEAKAGKPVQTRDGRKARFISDTLKASRSVVFGIMHDATGEEFLYQYFRDGTNSPTQELSSDLVMAPVERTVYVNFWKTQNGCDACSWPFETEKAARANASGYGGKTFTSIAVPVKITE